MFRIRLPCAIMHPASLAHQRDSMSNAGLPIVVAVAVFVVVCFAVGTQFNIRRGHQTMAWLQDGLKLLGERATLRWLGSAAVELKIQNATRPFRRAEVVIVMEPRDVAISWLYYRMRGRRDLLIVRGQLDAPPSFEFEALNPSAWSAHGIESKIQFRNWNPAVPALPPPLVAYTAGNGPSAAEIVESLSPQGCCPVRVAIRRTEPNLEVHWNLSEARKLPARTLLEAIVRFAERIPTSS